MKINLPKVTVVTVTYNAKQYLEQTIKSVIEQDYPNIEYIIIDGASTDGTIDIIKKYEKHLSYWISEHDTGIYDAMNKGIDFATGELINFMNAGDSFCEKNTISKVIKEMDINTDIIAGDIYYIDGNKKTYIKSAKLENKLNYMFCCHQTMFTKANLMKKYKFNTTFKIVSDYDFALKCAMNDYKFQFVNFAIANYLGGGFYESNRLLAQIENFFIQSKYIKNVNEIFNLYSYKFIKTHDISNHNLSFAHLMNSLHKWIDMLDLTKTYLLYGYGHIGKLMYDKVGDSIKTIVDMNYKNLSTKSLPIYNPLDINNFEFDYIIISVLGREEIIIENLIENLRIDKNKILTFELKNA
ncbi:glycosyltransferase [Aliarcobacter cryaerophilus]|uniref:glycosyltransferase family 2 protein n=1 Tax=Aliarcobacter cryaerophilus TaxID=28198 RepID=UPI0021B1F606|nr:glycosyltransferase family 2 protein [Aliarcobacter cryaerophilus]MCT7522585.1 glycosyltransferase [Aliarcobacter cryaerophilus]